MTRCRQTDTERREANRPYADSEFQIKPKEHSGRHVTKLKTDAERREAYRRDADKNVCIVNKHQEAMRLDAGWPTPNQNSK
jgi:hypothetical protein